MRPVTQVSGHLVGALEHRTQHRLVQFWDGKLLVESGFQSLGCPRFRYLRAPVDARDTLSSGWECF